MQSPDQTTPPSTTPAPPNAAPPAQNTNTSSQTPSTGPDPFLSRFREAITALIALVIIAGTIILIAIAAGASADQFARLKDLLLIVNPVVGIVIGYYFNRTSTVGRAESAEASAKDANEAAQKAFE